MSRLRHIAKRLRLAAGFLWLRLSAAISLLLVFLLALAVLSYAPQDASMNVSSGLDIDNWLGRPGAIAADMVLQLFGLAVWLILLPLGARAARQLTGLALNRPNWRFIAALAAPLIMALALALGGRQVDPLSPIPGGALGELLADGLEVGLARLELYMPRRIELALAYGLGAMALLAALFGSGLVRNTANLGWQMGRQSLRITRQLPTAYRRIRAAVVWLSPYQLRHFAARLPVIWRPRDTNQDTQQDGSEGPPQDTEQDTQQDGSETAAGFDTARGAVQVADKKPAPKKGRRAAREAQPSLAFDRSTYELPPLRLLTEHKKPRQTLNLSKDALEANARMLETVLADFGIKGTIGQVRPGPVVTLYELEPAAGVRSSRVVGLSDDIARSMSAVSARVAPVPGSNVIGIELPNQTRELVSLRELLSSSDFESGKSKLTMALGKNIGGAPVMSDLTKMPHLLVAGTTGSGKSVGINTMILSLLYRLTPDQCRLILVDPKMLELSVYDGIPHLLAPVVTEPKKAVVALKWVVQEMENRYRKMAKIGVRNIDGFNERMREAKASGETLTRRVQTGFDPESGEAIYEDEIIETEILPFIVVVIDEMADLMMVAGKEIEAAVQRLAQMARAAGVHLITATQRPSVDVITGTIKANFPSRISFQVTSKIDSRTVLGEQGAEQLLGQGDMLYMGGGGRVQRVHGPFVSDEEVEKVVTFLKKQGVPDYIEQVTQEPEETPDMESAGGDSLYDQAVAIVTRDGRASTSYVQRRLSIGYNRAARLIEQMEEQGVISPPNHAGKREILAGKH
ncbi:DNA translocase FtsK [Alphaproteobacteria bacterium]|nr:DNA translocase FtsK [Alphaproteobacteria bacterium]MDA9591332.1 DNA translocase FtsK [Alphaproteobacteria bacterium]MDB2380987.1 DNA translocase FtsK [Alphaproteobacteria bacterium]MDB2432211.1 DNA translocase FtsK [Alphaproteobacteria bacterium]MDB2462258.1 DNA translocase FtsK [Alphaproteobacteria bacterium]